MSYIDQWDMPEDINKLYFHKVDSDGNIILVCNYCDDTLTIYSSRYINHWIDCFINHMELMHKDKIGD